MIEKLSSALKAVAVSYCSCFIVFFILSTGKSIAAESNKTRRVYCIGNCDPQLDSEGTLTSISLKDIESEVKEKDVQIIFNNTQVEMNKTISFANLTSLNITGLPDFTIIACKAHAGAGIMLRDIESIMLTNLSLTGCGSLFINEFKKKRSFISALTMIHCGGVQINRLIIAQSSGTGLMILNHQGGMVNIQSAIFKENKLPQNQKNSGNSSSPVFGGGGMYILLGKFQESSNYSSITFQFDNCTFERNTARNKHFPYLYTDISSGELQKDCGAGGGVYLSIHYKNGISNVYVSFLNCTFTENHACVGAGLSMKVYGGNVGQEITNITFNITDSSFNDNGCSNNHNYSEFAHFGGGAYLAFSKLDVLNLLNRSGIENCHYHLTNVNFIRNCARYGGGIYYYSDRSRLVSNDNTALFDNCSFESNQAHIGSAVDMTPNIFVKLTIGYTIVPTFKNCKFLENRVCKEMSIMNKYIQKTPGLGTIRTSLQDIHFEGHNYFEKNWGTALYAVNANVNFQKSSATFVNNTGLQGGAIALIESATMIVGPNTYEFHNNTAFYQGGAIYVLLIDNFDITISRSCFIQYVNADCYSDNNDDANIYTCGEWPWKANITFKDNKVIHGKAGHTIYATSLYPCQVINNSSRFDPHFFVLEISKVFTERCIEISGDDQIATDAAIIHVNSKTPLMVIPGEEFSHGITVIDDLEQNASVLFRVKRTDENQSSDDIQIGTTFIGDKIQLMGSPNQSTSIDLYTLSSRQNFIEVDVELIECPPGFMLNDSRCVCNDNAPVGIYKCNLAKFHSHLLPGYWAGVMEEAHTESSKLVTCTCPFCDYNHSMSTTSEFEIHLPKRKHELDKAVCGDTRTGNVCGICRDGYTVHFHSPNFLCKSTSNGPAGCKFGWFFYILSEIIPTTLIFIIVLIFNISFTSGTISGFILFSQLLATFDIDASGIIKFSKSVKHTISEWAQGYQVLYGVFNLDFFNFEPLSFCLMTKASALDIIAFKYVTISYAFILIMTVIWIMNKCGGRCCAKYCRITTIKTSVIHGISSFLVICYTQCVRISMNLLNPVHFNVEIGSEFNPRARVWFNAEIEYFRKGHFPYALPALFFLLTIGILPPALLFSYPLLNKVPAFFGCDNLSLFSNKLSISKLKPLLDSFQSCYKDNMRFFAGLYFLYRMVILFIYAITRSYSAYYTNVTGALLVILLVHTICQPYVKRVHNIIDALLIANLILISSFSFYNYHINHYLKGVQHSTTTFLAVLQLVLIYLPLIVLGMYILVILCKNAVKCASTTDKLVPERANKLRELIRSISTENKDDDSNEVELTHDQLMDEDVEYNTNSCGYFKAASDTEMTLLDTYNN